MFHRISCVIVSSWRVCWRNKFVLLITSMNKSCCFECNCKSASPSPIDQMTLRFEIFFLFFVCAPKKIFIRKYLRFMLAIFLIFFYWTWSHNIYYRSFLNHQFDTPQNTNLQILCPPATKYRSRDSTALLLKYKSSYKISTKYTVADIIQEGK